MLSTSIAWWALRLVGAAFEARRIADPIRRLPNIGESDAHLIGSSSKASCDIGLVPAPFSPGVPVICQERHPRIPAGYPNRAGFNETDNLTL